jgi:hypothetical protein
MIGDVKYTPKVIKFMQINNTKTSAWLSNKINKYFKLDTTTRGVANARQRYNATRNLIWNDNVINYIKIYFNKISHSKMIEKLKYKFNLNTDIHTLSTMTSNFGFKYNVKRIRKPINSEKIFKSGRKGSRKIIYIKYRDLPTDSKENLEYKINWMPKTRYVWEQHFGKILKGYSIIQLDGNYENCNIENLRAVPKSIVPKITKRYGCGVITEAMIEILKLEEDINEAYRKR